LYVPYESLGGGPNRSFLVYLTARLYVHVFLLNKGTILRANDTQEVSLCESRVIPETGSTE
jgi:hypothetical protein